MPRISLPLLFIVSVLAWFTGIAQATESSSITNSLLIHLGSLGYLTGIFIWVKRSKPSDDRPVTFWKKSDPDLNPVGCFSGVFRFGIILNMIILTIIIILSNFFLYSN